MTGKFINFIVAFGLIVAATGTAFGQDLDSLMAQESKPVTIYSSATFKATRIGNGHSIEQMKKNQLEFRISHRFGDLNSGGYNLYGLDFGTIHLSLEYGITDWLELGIGRSTYEKTIDGFAKIKLLRQSSGEKNWPFQLSYLFSNEYISSMSDPLMKNNSARLTFVQQLLLARKFNEKFSLQLTPTFIHRNLVLTELDKNDLFAMGVGGRYKLSNRIALNAEYYYVYRANTSVLPVTYYNPLTVGIDIETGGHVFQILLSNAQSMREGGFIGKTTSSWGKGGICLGFNISRVFTFNKK
ncbi:MAG: DUF5777 family beta-barrel protein [Prolixibacteraceae bacterium]